MSIVTVVGGVWGLVGWLVFVLLFFGVWVGVLFKIVLHSYTYTYISINTHLPRHSQQREAEEGAGHAEHQDGEEVSEEGLDVFLCVCGRGGVEVGIHI